MSSNKSEVTSNKQRAKNNQQQAKSNAQRAKNNDPVAKSNEQRAKAKSKKFSLIFVVPTHKFTFPLNMIFRNSSPFYMIRKIVNYKVSTY